MAIAHPITAHACVMARHTTRCLSAGPGDGPLVVFVHGWPELAISWRHQIECFAAFGLRVVAPDVRGYGMPAVHALKADCAMTEIVDDRVEPLAHLGRVQAIGVGHDSGRPRPATGCLEKKSPSRSTPRCQAGSRGASPRHG